METSNALIHGLALPAETILQILENDLEQRDLMNVRMSCRWLNRLASPIFYSKLVISTKAALDRAVSRLAVDSGLAARVVILDIRKLDEGLITSASSHRGLRALALLLPNARTLLSYHSLCRQKASSYLIEPPEWMKNLTWIQLIGSSYEYEDLYAMATLPKLETLSMDNLEFSADSDNEEYGELDPSEVPSEVEELRGNSAIRHLTLTRCHNQFHAALLLMLSFPKALQTLVLESVCNCIPSVEEEKPPCGVFSLRTVYPGLSNYRHSLKKLHLNAVNVRNEHQNTAPFQNFTVLEDLQLPFNALAEIKNQLQADNIGCGLPSNLKYLSVIVGDQGSVDELVAMVFIRVPPIVQLTVIMTYPSLNLKALEDACRISRIGFRQERRL